MRRKYLPALAAAALIALPCAAIANPDDGNDRTRMPFEELINTPESAAPAIAMAQGEDDKKPEQSQLA